MNVYFASVARNLQMNDLIIANVTPQVTTNILRGSSVRTIITIIKTFILLFFCILITCVKWASVSAKDWVALLLTGRWEILTIVHTPFQYGDVSCANKYVTAVIIHTVKCVDVCLTHSFVMCITLGVQNVSVVMKCS